MERRRGGVEPPRSRAFRRRDRIARRVAFAAAFCLVGGAAHADDVEITTDTNNGVVLDAFSGTTAHINAGVTVSNTTFNFNCPTPPPPPGAMSLAAVCATTKAWTLTNDGTIGPADFGDAVHFTAGGSVVNFGDIDAGADGSNGIWIVGAAAAPSTTSSTPPSAAPLARSSSAPSPIRFKAW